MSITTERMTSMDEVELHAALAVLWQHALPKDAPGAWIRDAIEELREVDA